MVRRVATRTVDCCLEHERQTSNLPWPSSRRTSRLLRQRREEVDHGNRPQPLCGDGCVETGCEGLRPDRRDGSPQNRGGDTHLGLDHKCDLGVTGASDQRTDQLVVMEATGDYWKPFYYLLEDAD